MSTHVLMPKWGMSMQEGLVGTWLKQEGDPVEQGEEIVEIESEKAINLVEAPISGILARIVVPEGETVPITTVIAVIAEPGEQIADSFPSPANTKVKPSTKTLPSTSHPTPKPSATRKRSGRVAASPAARRLAREQNVELSELIGTGPEGMIVVNDVQAVLDGQSSAVAPLSRVSFYSQEHKLDGLLYLPKNQPANQPAPAVVFCLGFTYVKDLLVPDMARRLSEQGYAALVFDYRGFGKSEGPRGRLFPAEQITDIRSAVTYLVQRPEVDANRIGLVGISLGGSHALGTAAIDPRVQATAAISPIGDLRRWLSGTRPYWEWAEFLNAIEADRANRVRTGKSNSIDAWEIVAPDPASRAFLDSLYHEYPELACELSLESADALIDYCPETLVHRIAPRPVLVMHGSNDMLVPIDESHRLFANCGEPRRLVEVANMSHFDWANPKDQRFERVMEILRGWLDTHLSTN